MNYVFQKVYRFRIILLETEPAVWREIDVPADYNFWELHVAIQDAMGWLDYHLHEFQPAKKGPTQGKRIGIPDEEFDDQVVAGWTVPIKKYFTTLGNAIGYAYDFGDGWLHEVRLMGMYLADAKADFPLCVAGERACPPEDCGGVYGYQYLLDILKNPQHEEYTQRVDWLKNHAKNYWPYKPDNFSAKRVKFDDPYKRWCIAFDQPYEE